MKVIHLSTSSTNGGAAIAAKRIVHAQRLFNNLNAILLNQSKSFENKFVFQNQTTSIQKSITSFRKFLDELSIRLLTVQSRGRFTFPFWGEDVSQNLLVKNTDIINLHWINGGFLSLRSLERLVELNKPIVWTLHDMWAFTGGCHYTSGCIKFQTQCKNCPSLIFKSENDLSKKIFNRKKDIFAKLNLTVVTCSRWLANEAYKSALLSNKNLFVIPNPINQEKFNLLDRVEARMNFNLPVNKKLLLIGAMNLKDERKGIKYLIEALEEIAKKNFIKKDDLEIIVFGKLDENITNKFHFRINQLGKLKTDEDIIKAYNCADIYVAPSLQDNLPNTVMEAMACGVPVVAFNVGGIPDMIDHKINGILAEPRSSKELADGILLLLTNDELRRNFGTNARDKVVKNFSEKIVAEKYYELYKSLL